MDYSELNPVEVSRQTKRAFLNVVEEKLLSATDKSSLLLLEIELLRAMNRIAIRDLIGLDTRSRRNMWIVVVRQMIEICCSGNVTKDANLSVESDGSNLIPKEFERFKSIIILENGLRDVVAPTILEIIKRISNSFDVLESSFSPYLLSELLFAIVGDDVVHTKDAMCIITKSLEMSLIQQDFSPSNVERIITLMRLILAFVMRTEGTNNEILKMGSEWRSAWEEITKVSAIHPSIYSHTPNILSSSFDLQL